MKLTLGRIATICGGALRGDAEVMASGVVTDSRAVQPGQLFVAIRGDRFDAHDFLDGVAAAGAAAALIDRSERAVAALPTILVDDSVRALGALAAAHRAAFKGPVIAITGSNGKTTTKELCAALLTDSGVIVRRTPGNLNNHIGMPLSILALEEGDQALVVELGMNHPGEIDALAKIARPDIGAITQVAAAHLGPVGSLEGIALAKGELLDHIGKTGTAVLNADNRWVMSQAGRSAGKRMRFGFEPDYEYRAEGSPEDLDQGRFRMVTPEWSTDVALALPGRHLIANSLCAVAAAQASGLLSRDPARVRRTLEAFKGLSGRLELRSAPGGLRVIDDSYNANPESLRAAVATARAMAGRKRTVVVLGDMLELGPTEAKLHEEAGRNIAMAGVTSLIGVGPLAAHAVSGAKAAGLRSAETAVDTSAAAARVRELAGDGDVVLVKGSRGSRMERVRIALEESK